MQLSYAAVFAVLATVACAQSVSSLVSQLPACALTCLATASTAARCALTDYACQCGSAKDAITKSATPCITSGCSAEDALKTLGVSNQICEAVGSTSGSVTTAAAPAATTTTPAGVVVTQIGDGQIQVPVHSTATGSSIPSSFASFATSKSSPTGSTVPKPATTTTAAPVEVTTNAASKKQAIAVVVGAAFLAAFAL